MRVYRKITDLIGGTPLLELTNYEKANELNAKIYAKLEYFNPAGSVKAQLSLNRQAATRASALLPLRLPAVIR
mgnify:CR=1 FL=1